MGWLNAEKPYNALIICPGMGFRVQTSVCELTGNVTTLRLSLSLCKMRIMTLSYLIVIRNNEIYVIIYYNTYNVVSPL